MSRALPQLAKLRQFAKGMDLEKFMTGEFRQNMVAIERALNLVRSADGCFASGTSGPQAISTGTIVLFTNVGLNSNEALNALTGTLKIKQSGYYDFTARLGSIVNLSTSQVFVCALKINGTDRIIGTYSRGTGVSGAHSSLLTVGNLQLNEDDEVQLVAYSSVAATLSTLDSECYFSAKYVGA